MRNAAISWHFERDPIPYALDTDWLVGAAGFELPHFRIGIRHSNLALICGRFSRASQRDAAGVHLFTDSNLRISMEGGRAHLVGVRPTDGIQVALFQQKFSVPGYPCFQPPMYGPTQLTL